VIWAGVILVFLVFLFYPLLLILIKSFETKDVFSFANYVEVFSGKGFGEALKK